MFDLNYQGGKEKMSVLRKSADMHKAKRGVGDLASVGNILMPLGAGKKLRATRGHTAHDLSKQGLAGVAEENLPAQVYQALEL